MAAKTRSLSRLALVALVLLLLLLPILSACREKAPLSVRGTIVAVNDTGLLEWDSLVLRPSSGGADLTFTRGPEIDLRYWRAAHLREHMLGGSPTTVTYKKSGPSFVATDLSD